MELHAVQTWYDRHVGVVEVSDDVANIVRQVREMDPRIHVFYNEQTDGFDLVEHCLDGVQRLIFSVDKLDARILSRLREGDSWLGGNPAHIVPEGDDFLSKIDAKIEADDNARQEASLEKIRDAGERLAWSLDVAGVGYRDSIRVKKDLDATSGIQD